MLLLRKLLVLSADDEAATTAETTDADAEAAEAALIGGFWTT